MAERYGAGCSGPLYGHPDAFGKYSKGVAFAYFVKDSCDANFKFSMNQAMVSESESQVVCTQTSFAALKVLSLNHVEYRPPMTVQTRVMLD